MMMEIRARTASSQIPKRRAAMADNTLDTREQRPEPEANADPGADILPATLDLTLFTAEEATRLEELRQHIEQGRMGELTHDYKRLMFARWLVQHGKLGG